MRYIEPHAHMVSRTTDDYQAIAQAGCEALCEPAFWAGYDRGSVEGFRDYFRQLTEYEPARAAKFGIPHFTWLCINPKEADDVVFGREVLSIIPDFLDKPTVLGIGEIGLNIRSSRSTSPWRRNATFPSWFIPLILRTSSRVPVSSSML